jgi:HlyD family secretion protein
MIKRIINSIIKHKIISAITLVSLILISIFGFKSINSNKKGTSMVLGTVEKGSIIQVVSGSGQISSSNQLDVKSKVSGDVTYINVVDGQEVYAGKLLVSLDSTDASRAVRDAKNNLESAQLSLEQLKSNTDIDSDQTNITQIYNNAFSTISDLFASLPTSISNLQTYYQAVNNGRDDGNIDYYDHINDFYDGSVHKEFQYEQAYNTAVDDFNRVYGIYQKTSRTSSSLVLKDLFSQTYISLKSLSEVIRTSRDKIQLYKKNCIDNNLKANTISTATTDAQLTAFNTLVTSMNTYLNQLGGYNQTISSNNLDTRNQELTIEQKQNALDDAQDLLNDYSIVAPFSGIVAKVNIKKGDNISSSTSVVTLITKQLVAIISLNEVDVAKVKVGQKATLAFDALEDLNITGIVSEVDAIGTVSQGVVSYNVKINLDVSDQRIKSGMSVTASIIVDSKSDVLVIPSSAIKTSNEVSYVEISKDGKTSQQTIETGLSDDANTEVTSGLKEDDQIIVRTISSTTKTTTQGKSLFSGGGEGFRP